MDILDGKVDDALAIDVGFLNVDETEYEVSQQDREELDRPSKQLAGGVKHPCATLFKQASDQAKK
eukprot:7248042-Pyramimonas_sp.AAC.1